jgi:ABC-type antimicrobial peptide transport system permease subunit
LRLAAILPLSGAAADPDLTPELEGVTDQSTMADWDPPFPFDARAIGDEDEAYWDQYRATPKAFVSLARGREPWGSRFGRTTSVRFAPPEDEFTPQQAAARLDLSPEALGFVFQPLKRQAFEAAKGTTPFNLLFLGFSMFLIGAAVMLVALLYQLGIEQRTGEVGILLAEGFTPGAVQRIFTGEGMVTAVLGGAAGVALGIFYAWAMITGLQTLWLDAITTPFLNVAVNPWSLVIGYAASVLISVVAIYVSLRRLRRMSVSGLLALRSEPPQGPVVGEGRGAQFLTGGCLVLAVVAAIATRGLGGEAQAFAFFSSGVLVLTALLIAVRRRLRRGDTGSLATPDGWALARFAVRNGARNPGRSTLTIALVASASFLIVAISAFRRDSPGDDAPRDSGTGGFQLVAESDQPIFADLATVEGRDELGFSASDEEQLKSVSTYSLRVRQGDDASCLNLYQPRQPKVLGVSARLIERGGFAWHAAAERDGAKVENPWTLLEEDLGKTDDGRTIVPVVIDRDTAMYSLHLWSGVGQIYELPDGHGGMIPLQVVGLLVNSVFQGDLLISDAAFRRHFPQISGYRFFLFDVIPSKELATPAALPELNKRDDTASRPEGPEALKRRIETVSGILETRLKNSGLDVQRSRLLLEGFMAVQNTYLSMFQSLGGLGLLLGTFGLAAVQLRNILQRRGELALLRATGFRRQRLARLVLYENLALLLGGLGIGTLAAVLAVGPHWLSGGASVPWLDLALTLGVVALVGVGVSLWVVRAMLRTELIPALRGD